MTEPDNFFCMGTPPVMVDIMPKISGVKYLVTQLDPIKKEGREEWLRQREQRGASQSLEQIRAKGREDGLKLRQHNQENSRENSRDPQDRAVERDEDARPQHLSETSDKGLDDDLN